MRDFYFTRFKPLFIFVVSVNTSILLGISVYLILTVCAFSFQTENGNVFFQSENPLLPKNKELAKAARWLAAWQETAPGMIQWGFMDNKGQFSLPPRYEGACDELQTGLLTVKQAGSWGLINRAGETILDFFYTHPLLFSYGLAPAYTSGQWGYINTQGQMLIQPYYEQAQSFVKDGQHILARVKYKGLWGLIDQTGRFVLAPQYEYMTDCQYDRVGIKMENGYGFINKKGEVVIKPVFKKVKGFNQGLAPAQADNGLWGFISIHGKWIIQPAYADADSAVDNNRFPVKTGQYWGYIEKAGQTIVAPVYEQASAFSSGLARIYKKGIWGYLTLQGQIIWDTKNALFFENDETIPGKFKEKLLLALSKQAEFENINLKRILKARPWGGIPSDFLNNGSLVNDKNAELNFFNNFDNYNFIRTYLTSKVGQKPNPDWYRNNNWYGVIQIETKDLHQEETRWFWVELK